LDLEPKQRPRKLIVAREIRLTCLVWESFAGATARARGVAEELDCVPTCAQSGVTRRTARVVVSGLRRCHARRFYSVMRLVLGSGASAERPRAYLKVPCAVPGAP